MKLARDVQAPHHNNALSATWINEDFLIKTQMNACVQMGIYQLKAIYVPVVSDCRSKKFNFQKIEHKSTFNLTFKLDSKKLFKILPKHVNLFSHKIL